MVCHGVPKINTVPIPVTPVLETLWVNPYLWDTIQETHLSHTEKAAPAVHPGKVQDWLIAEHVCIQHHHCWEYVGNSSCKWKGSWSDHNLDVAIRHCKLFNLNSEQAEKFQKQSYFVQSTNRPWPCACLWLWKVPYWIELSLCGQRVLVTDLSLLWWLIWTKTHEMALFGNFSKRATAEWAATHCKMFGVADSSARRGGLVAFSQAVETLAPADVKIIDL